jgi:prevent-host-death family protein
MDDRDVINIHQAKTHLSRLVERVEGGEELVIGRAGKPIARLVPYADSRPARRFGSMRGRIRVLAGFDEMDEEIAEAFGASPGIPG